MQGVISTDAIELPVIWKACLWKMNLFGHGKRLTVFREKTEIYNSYLTMTYRYGWFMIVPYVLYQVFMLKCAVEYKWQQVSTVWEKCKTSGKYGVDHFFELLHLWKSRSGAYTSALVYVLYRKWNIVYGKEHKKEWRNIRTGLQ